MGRETYIPIARCPVCGKLFVPGSEHVYKVDYYAKGNHSRKRACSWSCMRKVEKEREALSSGGK